MDKFEEYLHRHKANLDVDSPADNTWQQVEAKLQAESNPAGETKRPALPTTSRIPMIKYAVAASLIVLAGAGLWLVVRNKPANPTATNSAAHDAAANPNTASSTAPKPAATNPTNNNTAPNIASNNASTTATSTATIKPKTTRSANPTPPKIKKTDHPTPNTIDEVQLIDKSYVTLINNQLKKLRSTPLYAESSNYFEFYVDQFKQMDHDEKTVRDDIRKYGLTNEILEQLINVYQQKLNLLKSLQTEVNKMNNKVRERQARPGKPEAHYLNI